MSLHRNDGDNRHMLRITKMAHNGSAMTLKLEGKIHGEWVSLLEQECKAAITEGAEIVLDFEQVTYVDDLGIELIRCLSEKHVKIVNGDTFIADLKD